MKISKEEKGNVAILAIDGEIDLYNAPLLSQELDGLKDSGKLKVILNLENVPFIDSSGIGALVTNMEAFREAGGLFVLTRLQKSIQDLLQYIQMSEQFLIYESDAEALSFFD